VSWPKPVFKGLNRQFSYHSADTRKVLVGAPTQIARQAGGAAGPSCRSVNAVRISRLVRAAVASLEDAEVGLVHIGVAIEVGGNDPCRIGNAAS